MSGIRKLLNVLKSHTSAQIAQIGQPRWGVVSSVNAAKYLVKVTLQPEGIETGWLPVGALTVGAASVLALTQQGQQVLLVPDSGFAEHLVVVCAAFSNASLPPVSPVTGLPVPAGEVAVIVGGACLHVQASGVTVHGLLTVQGNIVSTGDVSDSVGKLSGLRTHYDDHTHTGPFTGTTSTPTPTDP